jgi:hypothetical protein
MSDDKAAVTDAGGPRHEISLDRHSSRYQDHAGRGA